MVKKEYEKPTVNVVEMEQESPILAGSVGGTRGDGYGTADEQNWP